MKYRAITASLMNAVILIGVITGCQKVLSSSQVISIRATSDSVLADGSAMDTIYANLPIETVPAHLVVTFHASSGLFDNGADTMSVFANRTDISAGSITATAIFHASLRSGPDTVSVATSTVPQETSYLYLTLLPSMADSILLTPSSYMLSNTFGMQVTITAILQNTNGGMVSQGTKVMFSDQPDTNVMGPGHFQPPVATLVTSPVSTVYFPQQLKDTIGSYINITGVVLDPNGSPTATTSTTRIYISK